MRHEAGRARFFDRIGDLQRSMMCAAVVLAMSCFASARAGNGVACFSYEEAGALQAVAQPILPWLYDEHGFTSAAVVGSYAFCSSMGPYAFQVVDIGDSQAPVTIASYVLPAQNGYDVVAWGTYAYVANGPFGVRIVDVSDVYNPSLSGTIATPHAARCLANDEARVLVGCSDEHADSGECLVLDVAAGAVVRLDAAVEIPGMPVGICTRDSVAYVGIEQGLTRTGVLAVVDLRTSPSPRVVELVGLPAVPHSLAVRSGLLLVGLRDGTLCAYSLDDITAPSLASTMTLASRIDCLAFAGPDAALAGLLYKGVVVLDFASPAHPRQIGALPTASNNPRHIQVVQDVAWIADSGPYYAMAGLNACRLSRLRFAPAAIVSPEIGTQTGTGGLVAGSAEVYWATEFVISIGDPEAPNRFENTASAWPASVVFELAAGDGWLAASVADEGTIFQGDLLVYDVSDRAALRLTHRIALGPSGAHLGAVDDHLLAVGPPDSTILLYSVASADSLSLLSVTRLQSQADAVAASDGVLAVATRDGTLLTYWIGDDGALDPLISMATPGGCAGLDLSDGVLAALFYVSDPISFRTVTLLGMLDLRDGGAGREWSLLPMPSHMAGVALSGGFAYVVGNAGLQVVDVSDPAAPILQGGVYTGVSYAYACASPWGLLLGDSLGRIWKAAMPCAEGSAPAASDLRVVSAESCHLITGRAAEPQGVLAVAAASDSLSAILARRPETSSIQTLACAARLDGRPVRGYSLWGFSYPPKWTMLAAADALPFDPPPTAATLLRALPSPCRTAVTLAYAEPPDARSHLTIHDLRGRRIADLSRAMAPGTAGLVTWNLRDDAGRRVAAGSYVAVLAAAGRRSAVRFVVLD